MKKQLVFRALIGFPIGVFISNLISLIISYIFGNGYYITCAPEVITRFGSEIMAATVQFLLSGVVGAVYAAASIIWNVDSWSLFRTTVTHFFIIAITFLPISILMGWCALNLQGILSYLGLFAFIYFCIWISQYFAYKKKIQKINQALKK